MKVLFVTPYLPGPPIFGGQRRIHGLLSCLGRAHEVSVVALTDGYFDPAESIKDTQSYSRHVVAVSDKWHRMQGRKKRLLQLRSLVSRHSYEHKLYLRSAFQKQLDHHLALHDYDVVACEFMFMAAYGIHPVANQRKGRSRPLLVLDEHNIEYDILKRTASATSLGRRFFNEVNWRKLRREEVSMWKRFDGCTVTSIRDERIVSEEAPSVPTAVIPNGVDVELFRPRSRQNVEPFTLLFFGAINYYPNTDGALYFAQEILPLLQAKYPSLKFRIVGPVGPGPVMDLNGDRVQVLGFVDDVQAEIERAAVVVVPLRIGGGTRLKILEAMSMGKAVVSTSIGAEGLDVTHGEDILLADTNEGFAREVGKVLDDPVLAERLGVAARRTAETKYGWAAAAKKLADFYEQLLSSRRGR